MPMDRSAAVDQAVELILKAARIGNTEADEVE
jgi:hypothetical protein